MPDNCSKILRKDVMCKMEIFTLEVISGMNIKFQVFSLPELFKWKNINTSFYSRVLKIILNCDFFTIPGGLHGNIK